jgi:hypothetical protein
MAYDLVTIKPGSEAYALAEKMGLKPEDGECGIMYGRFYVTKKGYISTANKLGAKRIVTELVDQFCNMELNRWVVKTTVETSDGHIRTGYAKSEAKSVSSAIFGPMAKGTGLNESNSDKIRDKVLETAETHSIRRALENAYPDLIIVNGDDNLSNEDVIVTDVTEKGLTGLPATTGTGESLPVKTQEADNDAKKVRNTKRRKEVLAKLATLSVEDQTTLAAALRNNAKVDSLEFVTTEDIEQGIGAYTQAETPTVETTQTDTSRETLEASFWELAAKIEDKAALRESLVSHYSTDDVAVLTVEQLTDAVSHLSAAVNAPAPTEQVQVPVPVARAASDRVLWTQDKMVKGVPMETLKKLSAQATKTELGKPLDQMTEPEWTVYQGLVENALLATATA